MSYSVGQYITVICKKDNLPYKCKILTVNKCDNTIGIHYFRWSKNFDEIIAVDSDRIVDDVGDSQECTSATKRPRDEESSDDASTVPSLKRQSIANVSSAVQISPADLSVTGGADPVESEGVRVAEDLIDALHATLPTDVDDVSGDGAPESTSSSLTPVTASHADGVGGDGARGADSGALRGCGFCSRNIGGDCINCDRCGGFFHAETICVGISRRQIDALLETEDGALNYVCCECRIARSEGGEVRAVTEDQSPALRQLMTTVQGVVGVLREVTSELRMRSVEANNPLNEARAPVRPLQPAPPTGRSIRGAPLNEDFLRSVREINEREKRKNSIILRGLGDVSVEDASNKFNDLCTFLALENIVMTDIVKVGNHLFRGTVAAVESRMRLLSEARRLKGSVHGNVYIQRDLTYLQRQQLTLSRSRDNHGPDNHGRRNMQREGQTRSAEIRSRSFFPSRPNHRSIDGQRQPDVSGHTGGPGNGVSTPLAPSSQGIAADRNTFRVRQAGAGGSAPSPRDDQDSASQGGQATSGRGGGRLGARGGGAAWRGGENPTTTTQIRRNAFLQN